MESFKALYRRSAYQVRAKKLNMDGDILDMKFDTGAVNTILSLEALTDKTIDKPMFISDVEGKAEKKIFRSASGNEMTGYLVCADDILLSFFMLKHFYYYLIVDVDVNVALLGDDFISHCTFCHSNKSDILIENFDYSGYEAGFLKSIDSTHVSDLLDLCEKPFE